MIAIEWKRPAAVRDWEWQTEGAPQIRKLFGFFARWCALLGLPALYLVYRVAPAEMGRLLLTLLTLPLVLPALLGAQLWLSQRTGASYRLDERGLWYRFSAGNARCRWAVVQQYCLRDHPTVAGIRLLELRVGKGSEWLRWSFDPAEVREEQLIAVIRHHQPMASLLVNQGPA